MDRAALIGTPSARNIARRTFGRGLPGGNEPASFSPARCTLLAPPDTVLNQRLRAAAARPGPSIRAALPDLQVCQLREHGVATRSEFGPRGPRESARARSRRNRLVLRSCRCSVTLGARTPPPGRRTRAAGARLLCVGSRTGAQHDLRRRAKERVARRQQLRPRPQHVRARRPTLVALCTQTHMQTQMEG